MDELSQFHDFHLFANNLIFCNLLCNRLQFNPDHIFKRDMEHYHSIYHITDKSVIESYWIYFIWFWIHSLCPVPIDMDPGTCISDIAIPVQHSLVHIQFPDPTLYHFAVSNKHSNSLDLLFHSGDLYNHIN